MSHGRLGALCVVVMLAAGAAAWGQTGTFVDRVNPNDVRVVQFNMYFDSLYTFDFGDNRYEPLPHMVRLVEALDADVWNFQEVVDPSAADFVDMFNQIMPDSWQAWRSSGRVTVSRLPMSMKLSNVPGGQRGIAMSLIDLPDESFGNDLYILNNHFPCCTNQSGRQNEADAIVSWLADAETAGGSVDLPQDTAIAVLGDLNIVGTGQPLTTVVTGNISNNGTYGPDTPPDWDGTSLGDAHPYHNDELVDDYTWRDDSGSFDPGRLDYVLYTDSVIDLRRTFILNTMEMSASELTATGLEATDVMRNMNQPGQGDYDHLPLVADFMPNLPVPGDADGDGDVDNDDYDILSGHMYQPTANGASDGDFDGDGDVDFEDFVILALHHEARFAEQVEVIPEPGALAAWAVLALSVTRRRRSHQ